MENSYVLYELHSLWVYKKHLNKKHSRECHKFKQHRLVWADKLRNRDYQSLLENNIW